MNAVTEQIKARRNDTHDWISIAALLPAILIMFGSLVGQPGFLTTGAISFIGITVWFHRVKSPERWLYSTSLGMVWLRILVPSFFPQNAWLIIAWFLLGIIVAGFACRWKFRTKVGGNSLILFLVAIPACFRTPHPIDIHGPGANHSGTVQSESISK